MKQEVLKNFDITWLPASGLCLFIICFLAYTFWTFKKSNRSLYEQAALIPFSEVENERRK